MKQVIVLSGAVAALILFGGLMGGSYVWTQFRINGIQNEQVSLANDLNTRVFPGIQKRLELLEAVQKPATVDKKK